MSVNDGKGDSETVKLAGELAAKDTAVEEKALAEKAAEDEQKLRQKIYEDLCNEARKRQLSSSENFDKSILTYSASGLALSLAFLKDFIPITKAELPWVLYGSWVCFVVSITLTTLSFAISYRAQEKAIEYCEKYYIDRIESYFNKQSCWDVALKWANRVSSVTFIAAIVATSCFIGFNLKTASEILEKKMSTSAMAPALVHPSGPVAATPNVAGDAKVSSRSTKTERVVTTTVTSIVTITGTP
ncbi:hypothetical protein [Herbaspirillum hiltneri]|uniref:hypothetical protein n=1 Tax=Herbaspirillum hiltneri TaxID=341045 RepID=UPI00069E2039|nr:hypothetical protein [Herbaspirillum hiltneri]